MNFGSVCSGIEAASAAWHPLGWQAAWFSEIEPFPSAVLAHHYPDVPNLGDMLALPERIRLGEIEAPDILCGGTPCQAFSVAGLRRSLEDARGNLSLTFCEIADAIDECRSERGEPEAIIFWENVPGVLSTADNAFGCFLAGLAGEDDPLEPPGGKWTNAGYVSGPKRAIAWRVLDAQYFGVAQRRRRVFVVASARNGFDPAAVLFEFEGVRRDSAPSREAGEVATGGAGAGAYERSGVRYAHYSHDYAHDRLTDPSGVNPALTKEAHASGNLNIITMAHGQGGAEIGFDRGPTLTCNHEAPIAAYATCVTGSVTHTLKAEGFDAGEDGAGRGQPIVVHGTQDPCYDEHVAFALGRNNGGENAIAFQVGNLKRGAGASPSEEVFPTLKADHGRGLSDQAPCIAFSCKDHGADAGPISPTLRGMGHDGSHANAGGQVAVAVATFQQSSMKGKGTIGYDESGIAKPVKTQMDGQMVHAAMSVRRLLPEECEKLQGFPKGYTKIPWRNKPAEDCPDGPRYKALGNSWAVPNVRWIGRRIQEALSC